MCATSPTPTLMSDIIIFPVLPRIHLFDMFMRKRNGCELDYPVGEAVRMFATEQDIAKRKTTEIVLRKSDFNLSC